MSEELYWNKIFYLAGFCIFVKNIEQAKKKKKKSASKLKNFFA